MSYFKGLKLTKKGEQLQAKINGNLSEILTFTKVKLGSGTISGDDEIRFLTELKQQWGEASISRCEIKDETKVEIELQFDNSNFTENKIFREIGLYAKAKDNVEVLFAYANAGANYDYIPAVKDSPHTFIITIHFGITSGTKVNAAIDLNSYVTIKKLNEELAKKTDSYTENDSNKFSTAKALFNLYQWVKDIFTIPWGRVTGKPNLTTTEELNRLLAQKENVIDKKSGFNLDKSDSVSSNNSSTLATSAAVKIAYDKGSNAERIANTKEPAFSKNNAFNKSFGTSAGTVMEGDKYPIIERNFKGIAGNNINPSFIQDGGQKYAGQFYLDRNTGHLHKCIKSTSSTSNNAEYFEDVSLEKLSDRLNNLFEIREITSTQFTDYMGVREFAYYFDTKNLISAMPKDISGVVVEYLVFNNGSIFAGSKNQEVTSHTIRCVFFRNLRY